MMTAEIAVQHGDPIRSSMHLLVSAGSSLEPQKTTNLLFEKEKVISPLNPD